MDTRVNKVIVIGDVGGEGLHRLSDHIERQELTPRICRTIYQAVVELAQPQAGLLVGTPSVLARENGALMSLAEKTCVTCCCLIESPVSLSDALIGQIGQGSVVLCHIRRFRVWLETYLGPSGPPESSRGQFHDLVMSGPLVSPAEQAALLGGYEDV